MLHVSSKMSPSLYTDGANEIASAETRAIKWHRSVLQSCEGQYHAQQTLKLTQFDLKSRAEMDEIVQRMLIYVHDNLMAAQFPPTPHPLCRS